MAKLCLGLMLLTSLVFADTDPQWESALKLLEEGKNVEAVPVLETWLQEAEGKGTRSPEAHHNLAVAHARLERWAPAVYHLVTSASLRQNPFYRIEALRSVSLAQNRLLIQDSVASHWPFRVALFLTPTVLLWLGCAGFWAFAFALLFRTPRRPLLWTGSLALLLVASGVGLRACLPRFAVVAAEGGTALRTEVADTSAKLVDLPLGTLVAYSAVEGPNTYVTRPFAGWVTGSALKSVLEP